MAKFKTNTNKIHSTQTQTLLHTVNSLSLVSNLRMHKMRKTHQIQSESLFVLLFFIASSVYGEYAEHSLTTVWQSWQ